MPTEVAIDLPAWAIASGARRMHIARVVALADSWAHALGVAHDEAAAWHDAARLHDALRDAPEPTLREITGDTQRPAELLHGPAAARMLEQSGEDRRDVLDAIRYHTTGSPHWSRTGRVLFMADFLEPGRAFSRPERAALADRVARDFDATFREVVRMRIEWALHEGHALYAETVALWNALR